MTPQTLSSERREKFLVLLKHFDVISLNLQQEELHQQLADALVLAARSRTEKLEDMRADETAAEYNTELFKGDWREYPEHLHETARVLRDVWHFVLPAKPQKKTKEYSKGNYAMFVMAMEQVKQSCGELGVEKVLTALHDDWRKGFKDGIAPYTIAQPTSLINVANGKAREMREGGELVHKSAAPKGLPEVENLDFVPAPERK